MIGSIIGDIVGSIYEEIDFSSKDFKFLTSSNRFTDDTVMTLAVANALFLTRKDRSNLEEVVVSEMLRLGRMYPRLRWGKKFGDWLFRYSVQVPLNSYGNGSAMRIAPVAWVANSKEELFDLCDKVTQVTHNHPEGMKGARAIALATYLARSGFSKKEIRNELTSFYPELENMSVQSIVASGYGDNPTISWVTCQGSVPQAIACFLDSTSFEDAIRNAIYINGDSDTLACMTGSIAEAYYGVNYDLENKIEEYLDDELKSIIFAFRLIKQKRIVNPSKIMCDIDWDNLTKKK